MFSVKLKSLSKPKDTFRWRREFKKKLRKNLDMDDLRLFWNVLKIKADPKIDVDFTKGISALSIYGHNFRTSMSENIPEDSVHIRPDVTFKLKNLNISDGKEEDCNANVPQQDNESDVLRDISSLCISDFNLKSLYDKLWNLDVSENIKETTLRLRE